MTSFTKLDDGTWGVRANGATPAVGDTVTVSKRDGTTSTVTITEALGGGRFRFSQGSAPAARKPRSSSFTPTGEQAQALALFREGASIAIKAGAGTGKTSTLTILADDADERGLRGQYVAFNKKIVADSTGRFPASVSCDTAHSLAWRAVGYQFQARLESGARMKSHEIARVLGADAITVTKWDGEQKTLSPEFVASLAVKTVLQFCKTADLAPGPRHVPHVENLDAAPSPDRPTSHSVNDAVARAMMPVVTRAWNDLTRFQGALPFTKPVAQAISLKLWQLSEPKINADYILFDEAQDAAPVMVAVIANQTAAQLVWVGDDNQQIYSFTGAINALATVPADRQAYLTQSFRFGPAIADLANEILATLPTIMRLTGTATITSRVAALDAPRAILTRTNATAIRHVLAAIENDQRPYLVGGGKDVAAFCRAAVRLQDGLRVDHPELACFGTWGEVQEYVESDEQGDDLRLMVKLIDEFTAQAILDAVNGCAKEEDADVIVSTAHKAKGCEWDSVKVGADFPERAKMGNEERRLLYVAVTRARYEVDVTAVEFFAAVEEVAVA